MRPAEEERGWVKKYGAHIVRPASSRQQGSEAVSYTHLTLPTTPYV